MKKILVALVGVIFLTSCQFSEHLYLNEDGTGKISVQFDGSSIMQMMSGKMGSDKMKEKIDTIINFKTLLESKKDSIKTLSKEQQKRIKALENFKMHFEMDPEALKMNFDMFTEFKSISDLDNVFDSFQTAASIAGKSNKNLLGGGTSKSLGSSKEEPSSKVNYSYKRNKFKRSVTIIDAAKLQSEVDSLGGMVSFLSSSKYKLVYHFPRKVKKVSVEGAMFSADGKTMTLEKDFLSYLKNPKVFDIEVELEQ